MKRLSLLVALAACAPVDATPSKDISVQLSAVTLGDNCNRPPPPPAPSTAVAPAQERAVPAKPARRAGPSTPSVVSPADCAGPGCGHSRCEQTSMQLAIKSPAGTAPTTVKIKKVELLDAKGKVLQELASKTPSRWSTGTGAYVQWDETIAPGELQVMYELAAPDWDKLTNGRWNAHSKTFQLRVTVTLGGKGTKTVEKQSITPARLPPPVPT